MSGKSDHASDLASGEISSLSWAGHTQLARLGINTGQQKPTQSGVNTDHRPGQHAPHPSGVITGHSPPQQKPTQSGVTTGHSPGQQAPHPSGVNTTGDSPPQQISQQSGATTDHIPGQQAPHQSGATTGHSPTQQAPTQSGVNISEQLCQNPVVSHSDDVTSIQPPQTENCDVTDAVTQLNHNTNNNTHVSLRSWSRKDARTSSTADRDITIVEAHNNLLHVESLGTTTEPKVLHTSRQRDVTADNISTAAVHNSQSPRVTNSLSLTDQGADVSLDSPRGVTGSERPGGRQVEVEHELGKLNDVDDVVTLLQHALQSIRTPSPGWSGELNRLLDETGAAVSPHGHQLSTKQTTARLVAELLTSDVLTSSLRAQILATLKESGNDRVASVVRKVALQADSRQEASDEEHSATRLDKSGTGMSRRDETRPATEAPLATSATKRSVSAYRRSASRWRQRVRELEEHQAALQYWVQSAVQTDGKSLVELDRLRQHKDVLHSQLRQRERGMLLWRQKEDDFRAQIHELNLRMNVMSKMIRERETECEALRYRDQKHVGELHLLRAKYDNRHRGLAQVPEHKVKVDQAPKPPSLKLPTIVSKPRRGDKGGSVSQSWDPAVSRTRLPPVDFRWRETTELHEAVDRHRRTGKASSREHAISRCWTTEAWVSRAGATLTLPIVTLTVPVKAVEDRVLVTATLMDVTTKLEVKLASAGLGHLVQPDLRVQLEPHGYMFTKPILLECDLSNVGDKNTAGNRFVLVYHKDIDHHKKTEWDNISSDVGTALGATNKYQMSLKQNCAVQLLKVTIPDPPKKTPKKVLSDEPKRGGRSGGYGVLSRLVLMVLNNRTASCTFTVFKNKVFDCLLINCSTLNAKANSEVAASKWELVTSQTSVHELCDGNTLQFRVTDKSRRAHPEMTCEEARDVDLSEAGRQGQLFTVPLAKHSARGASVTPGVFRVYRFCEAPGYAEHTLVCEADLAPEAIMPTQPHSDQMSGERALKGAKLRSSRLAVIDHGATSRIVSEKSTS